MAKKKMIGLDYMRVFMMLMIFGFHAWMHADADFGYLSYFINAGAVAMEGFFMLSGFVLIYQYGEIWGGIELRQFYRKRFWSLFPLYFLFVIAKKLLQGGFTTLQGWVLLPFEVLGLTSSFDGSFSTSAGDWFVSCMFFCYFCYPLLYKVISITKRRMLLVMLYVISAVAPITASLCGYSWTYPNPFYRMLQFGIGMILAMEFVERKEQSREIPQRYLWGGISLTLVVFILSVSFLSYRGWGSYASYEAITIPCWGMLLLLLSRVSRGGKLTSLTEGMARISYAFYLMQAFAYALGVWIVNRLSMEKGERNIVIILVCFCICLFGGILLTELDRVVHKKIKW